MTTPPRVLALALAAGLLLACDGDGDGDGDMDAAQADTTPTDTMPPPPADSCVERCGSYDESALCQCDPGCVAYDNCCGDFSETCAPPVADTDYVFATDDECADDADWLPVTFVRDGDTIDLANGSAVRFLLVDTPEVSSNDCMADEAEAFTRDLIENTNRVCLVQDPTSGNVDTYDRLLRYVYVRDPLVDDRPINLNLRLIRLGFGRLLYPYAAGRVHEQSGIDMQRAARDEDLGIWGICY